MILVIAIVLAGGFAALLVAGAKVQKRSNALADAFLKAHKGWETYLSTDIADRHVLAIDATTRRIAIGKVEDHLDVDWSDISRVEVEKNGTSLTTTNRGSQLLGGVVGNALLGPLGLLVGGLSGSKATRQRVNDLALKLVIDHPTRPVHRVVFLKKGGKGYKPKASQLIYSAGRLDHFHALLINAMRAIELERSGTSLPEPAVAAPKQLKAAPPAEVEHRLERLWALHQAGALTEGEYTLRKQRLLADNPE